MIDPAVALGAAAGRAVGSAVGPAGGAASSTSSRTALLVGARGRLGEALLNELLAHPGYARVHVAAAAPIEGSIARLSAVPPQAWPAADDAFVCLQQPGEPFGRSYYGRDDVFEPADEQSLPDIGGRLARAGIRRVALVAPLAAFQQMSGAARTLAGETEWALVGLPLDTLVVLRPAREAAAPPTGSRLQRFVRFYLGQLRYMLPRGYEPIASDALARATVRAMREAGAGLTVLGADRVRLLSQRSPPPA